MNIKFADNETLERFQKCRAMSAELDHSLDWAIGNLMCWHPFDGTALISRDFHDQSFFFQEIDSNGRRCGICGGIIFHGRHDNGGDGGAPTFSVNMSPTDGYAIHT